MKKITNKQLAVFKYIVDFQKTYDNFPTSRCMMEELGFASQTSPMLYFKALEKKGYIEKIMLEGRMTLRRFTTKGKKFIKTL